MTDKDILKIITMLKMYYPNAFKDYTDADVKTMKLLWLNKFKDYTFKEMSTVVERLSSKMKFCPSVAEILEELAYIKNPVLQLNADQEWEKVKQNLRQYGFYRMGEGVNELEEPIRSIVIQIGYHNLATATSDNMVWLRKQFIEMFEDRLNIMKNSLVINEGALTLNEIQEKAKIEGSKQIEGGDQDA